MEDKHKRISQAQLDIWLDNPVTKTYLQCLMWCSEQRREIVGGGALIDATNNDCSMNNIHMTLGEETAFSLASKPEPIFHVHKMLEEEDQE